ncbi:MAG: CHASE2 domain-containing protein [Acidobacteria bacterium]|nr:CHASE2 domain-containing protein [Acidobacteriota bacterium]
MIGRTRRTIVGVGLVPMLLVVALSLFRPALLNSLERAVYDTLARRATPRPPTGRVVIVDVDERSLTSVGQWPWRRDVIGRLIANLRALDASVIALDIIFAEADRFSDRSIDPDAVLATSIAGGRVVLGYGLTFDGAQRAAAGCVQHPWGVSVFEPAQAGTEQPFFEATSAVCNLPQLTAATNVSGFLNAAPDSDGILRRVPLLATFEGRVYPSLALAAVSAVTGADDPVLQVANANAAVLNVGDRNVPLDGKSNMLVRFRGPKGTFSYLSAVDVLQGTADPEAVRGKVVLVGTTALGTREVVATPLDTLFTGVEVQATAADNLLQGDPYRRPLHAAAMETLLALVMCGAVLAVVWRYGLIWAGLTSTASLILLWGISVTTLSNQGLFVSPLFPTLGVITGLVSMVVAGFTTERARAERAGEANETSRRLMVQTLLSLTGIRDAETGRHSRRTQHVTRILAQQLSTHPAFRDYLTPERVELLSSLAPLHDIGKVGVPDRVLNKPGVLTPDELIEMRQHPRYGREVIEQAQRAVGVQDDVTLELAKDIVYTHHEKWDGTGYPEGLRGTAIPIPGRIMALVDVYDAVHTRRLYDAPRSHGETIALIQKGSGTHFDPAVVEAFVAVADTLEAIEEAA